MGGTLSKEQAMKVLVTAGSKNGSTWEIAAAVADQLRDRGLEVSLLQPQDVGAVQDYDAAVIGSAVYAGRWVESVKAMVRRFGDELAVRPVWLFSSGPVGKQDGRWFESIRKGAVDSEDAAQIVQATRAREHVVFSGRLCVDDLPFAQRVGLMAFRSLEGDFRDWAQITEWASGIADFLTGVAEAKVFRAEAVGSPAPR
jgi:menaquinone-dependent protoporphyrinogen oxidase